MLPRRCVEASRACDWQGFEASMASAGLGEVLARKASAKVAFWLVKATAIPESSCCSDSASDSVSEEDASLIAVAHAAGEFAVSMRRGGEAGSGVEERGKKKKKEKEGS